MNEGNRREWVGRAVDGVLEWWLSGTTDPDMAEWWATDEAPETALELVYVVRDAIENAGYVIVKVAP